VHDIAAQVYPDIVHAEDVAGAASLTGFVREDAARAFALSGDEREVAVGLDRVVRDFPRLWHVIPQPLDWTPDFPDRVTAVRKLLSLES
jgi:hypothetical protein